MRALRITENITKFTEEYKMKSPAALLFLAIATLFVTSCSTSYYSAVPVYDDVYYTAKAVPVVTETVVLTDYTDNPSYAYEEYGEGEFITEEDVYEMYEPSYEESYSYTDPNGDTYVTNNYYADYYDYSYASRIRRFYYPYLDSYYSPYYTSPCYYDPWYCGSGFSFSMGFGFGWGSVGFSYGYPYYGYPSYGWGYPYYGWYDPWWGYPYYGYGSYWNGYWNGYWDGYYDGSGYYPDYYPEYASVYYGPRNSGEGSNVPGEGGGSRGSEYKSVTPGAGNGARGSELKSDGAETARTSVDANHLNNRSGSTVDLTRPSAEQGNSGRVSGESSQRSAVQNPVTTKPAESRSSTNTGATRESYAKPKTYNPPVYTRPKSSQEYKAPGSGNVRQYTNPGSGKNTYTKPSAVTPRGESQSTGRSGYAVPAPARSTNTRSYTAPSQPSRSYSTPPRSSSPSYSAPSRSSTPSYSAPSRSSGSSSSSRSGSSSSGSGGRR